MENEVVNHWKLSLSRHPHVIHFREVFLTDRHVAIVLEYANRGSVHQYVKLQKPERRLNEAAARWIFQQLIIAVDFCHRKGVVNRDIKLENVLLHEAPGTSVPFVKIADFGFSKADCMSSPKSRVGTIAYVAPEVIKNTSTGCYCGKQADVWSCGVILHKMLFGTFPFDPPCSNNTQVGNARDREMKMMGRIILVQWTIPEHIAVSDSCIDLLTRIFTAEPLQRITISQLQRHAWFTTDLPPTALTMNDDYLKEEEANAQQNALHGSPNGHQAAGIMHVHHKHKDEESIRIILNEAFQGMDEEMDDEAEMIDAAIQEQANVASEDQLSISNSL